jgi:hypothetical protein
MEILSSLPVGIVTELTAFYKSGYCNVSTGDMTQSGKKHRFYDAESTFVIVIITLTFT